MKLLTIYFTLLTIVLILTYDLFTTLQKSNVGKISKNSFKTKALEREQFIKNFLSPYETAILSIQNDKNFKDYLSGMLDESIIENFFLTLKKSFPCLYQVKYIDLNANEIIKVDGSPIGIFKEKAKSFVVEKDSLKNISKRYYVKDFLNMEKEKIAYSNIDLSHEGKTLQNIKKVTLRLGVTVFDNQNNKKGIIVFNICLYNMFKQLENSTLHHLFLIDNEGDFLLHHNMQKYGLLGNDLNYSIFNEMNNIAKTILLNDEFSNEKFYSKKINMFNNNQNIKLILKSKFHDEILASNYSQNIFITILLLLAFIMLFVSIYISKLPDLLKEKLKNKEEIEDKNRFINSLLKSIPTPMFYKDENGVYFELNEAFTEIFGLKRDELVGKTVHDVAPKELADNYKYHDDKLINTKTQETQIYGSTINNPYTGKLLEVIFFKNLFFNSKGEVKGIIGSAIDVTELKSTQRQLQELNLELEKRVKEEVKKNIQKEIQLFESNKLASMGSMIGNIIHQWKQPLNIISIIASTIRLNIELGNTPSLTEITKDMDLICNSITRLEETTHTFRNFLKDKKEIKIVNLNKIVKDALDISGSMLYGQSIQIEEYLSEDNNFEISTYPNELIEVIVNIVNNAFDVIEERNIESGIIKVETKFDDNSYIITISDNAGGISDELILKIFNKYFTTKKDDKGTGLGLYMSKKIVEESLNGTIDVKNLDNGAVFIIELPKK